MILTDRTITVQGNKATIDSDIYLYRGDQNVEVNFTIVNSKFRFSKQANDNIITSTNASYAIIKLISPNSIETEFPVREIEDGQVKWFVEKELIDELDEVGKYDIQIRLLDNTKTSIITMPPVYGRIEVLEPLFMDDTALTGVAKTVNSKTSMLKSPELRNTLDIYGKYNRKYWVKREVIYDTDLNTLEDISKINRDAVLQLISDQGDIKKLNTIDKSSVVNALREIKTQSVENYNAIKNMGSLKFIGVYSTVSELERAHPTGTNGIALVTSDGYGYYWNGSIWTKGTPFQSSGFGYNSVTIEHIDPKLRSVFYYENDITSSLDFSVTGGLMADGTIGTYGGSWLATNYLDIGFACTSINYTLAGYSDGGSIILAGIVFYDEYKTFISSVTPLNADSAVRNDTYGIRTYILSGNVKVPSNAKYVRFGNANVNKGSEFPFTDYKVLCMYDDDRIDNTKINSKKIVHLGNSLNDVLNSILAIKYKPDVKVNITGGLLDDGTTLVNGSWGQSDYYDIGGYSRIEYDTCGFQQSSLILAGIAFYDINKTFISSVTPSNANEVEPYLGGKETNGGDYLIRGIIEVPSNAKYAKFGNRIGSDKLLYPASFTLIKIHNESDYVIDAGHVLLDNNVDLNKTCTDFKSNIKVLTEDIKNIKGEMQTINNNEYLWKGKKCAFIGDSITHGIGTTKAYHVYLAEYLGIIPYNYGWNGATVDSMYSQITKAYSEHPDLDAIFIFGGTNDYNANVPIGTFYTESDETVNVNGSQVSRKFRNVKKDDTSTFCNRLNKILNYAKTNFPHTKVILMTPIHRGYATFGDTNVQPEENYANGLGLYIDDYVDTVIKAGSFWSCNVINLFRDCGLYPSNPSYASYFANSSRDMLHPNAAGHEVIAKTITGELSKIRL